MSTWTYEDENKHQDQLYFGERRTKTFTFGKMRIRLQMDSYLDPCEDIPETRYT